MQKTKWLFLLIIIPGTILCLSGCVGSGAQAGNPTIPVPSPAGPAPSQYHYYFGQFHSHTAYSDGVGTPAEGYIHARDEGGADFMAITDHSHYFDHSYDWSQSAEWAALKQAAIDYTEEGRFIAIAGFEMSFSSPVTGRGHINTFNTVWFESKNNPGMDLPGYYQKVKNYPEAILQWNHPGTFFGDFNNFGGYDPAVNRALKLVEVGNGEGKPGESNFHPSYEYYTTALDQGWHVGPSNNQDNHHANWITANPCRTVVLAHSLTQEEIFDAIRNLRVYATEDQDLTVNFQINGVLMGGSLRHPDLLEIKIQIVDPDPGDLIQKIEVIADYGAIAAAETFASSTVNWSLRLPPAFRYYYLKITEADGGLAVTAPIWTGR
ncbi:MAG: CehA/McbA family metallohydrolase [Firmicutes bacterium]|nr:CehA/McbA family metallohydrolase [Bacillota bacterium]